MGPPARTPEPPKVSGWYVVWRASGGAYAPPDVHFCAEVEGRKEIGCMAAQGDTAFTSVRAPHFAGALWHGPFASRREARAAASAA